MTAPAIAPLPIPSGCSRKTAVLASARVAGHYVELHSVRYGAIGAHSYAKGGPEGSLGPVRAYGVSVEDADGILILWRELRDETTVRALYDRCLAKLSNREG